MACLGPIKDGRHADRAVLMSHKKKFKPGWADCCPGNLSGKRVHTQLCRQCLATVSWLRTDPGFMCRLGVYRLIFTKKIEEKEKKKEEEKVQAGIDWSKIFPPVLLNARKKPPPPICSSHSLLALSVILWVTLSVF